MRAYGKMEHPVLKLTGQGRKLLWTQFQIFLDFLGSSQQRPNELPAHNQPEPWI